MLGAPNRARNEKKEERVQPADMEGAIELGTRANAILNCKAEYIALICMKFDTNIDDLVGTKLWWLNAVFELSLRVRVQ